MSEKREVSAERQVGRQRQDLMCARSSEAILV